VAPATKQTGEIKPSTTYKHLLFKKRREQQLTNLSPSVTPFTYSLGTKKFTMLNSIAMSSNPMVEQTAIKHFYREKRFLFLLFAPLPMWIYLYATNGRGYTYTLEFFLTFAVLYPVAEEVLFRGLIQPALGKKLPTSNATISTANIITSLLFSAAHLINHSPLWALATFVPSLVYGYTMDRYKTLYAPIILHCGYNAGYFAVAGSM